MGIVLAHVYIVASFSGLCGRVRALVRRSEARERCYSMHSLLGGSGGMLSKENLDRVRVLLRPSETVSICVATGV